MYKTKKTNAKETNATAKEKGLKNTKKENKKVKKTAQHSIPFIMAYPNGVIETEPNVYSKMYEFTDINFTNATDVDQYTVKEQWGKVLGMFTPDMNVELTIFNRIVDEVKVYNKVLCKPKADNYNQLREEANHIIKLNMQDGRNNLECEKYITVSFASASIQEAFNTFGKLDLKLTREFSHISENIVIAPVSIAKRLSIIYDIYNPYSEISFERKYGITKANENTVLQMLAKMGLSSKDAVSPTDITFGKKTTEMGDCFARTVYIDNLPSTLTSDFLCDLANQECSALTSVYFKQLNAKKASDIIQNQMMGINREVANKQSAASAEGRAANLPPALQQAQVNGTELLEEMMNENQKYFLVTIAITLFANTEDELENYYDALRSIASRYVCDVRIFKEQQENAFNSVLPLANNMVYTDIMLHTESASIFIPFSSQELSQEDGQYYGKNAVSNRILQINKFAFNNANAMFLGKPGSGKSMQAKWEIIMSMLTTDDDIYIIDPEGEYSKIAALFPDDAEVVELMPGTTRWMNPLDLDIDDTDGADPIATKCAFVWGMMTAIFGDNYVLNPGQKSILNRCVTELYKPYIKHLEDKSAREGIRITYDYAAAPTLLDLYEMLMRQDDPDAVQMGIALEMHCQGPNAIFAHKTNINIKKRMVVYNTKHLEGDVKLLGLYTCTSHAWNKMICNQSKGKGTDVYMDEFHLYLQVPSVLETILSMYKRARKFGGAMRGITQNITDLFASPDTLKILTACEFVVMMNQSAFERELLANQYNLSDTEIGYITNSPQGTGLIYAGKNIYPFENILPENSIFYKAMSTNHKEKPKNA